MRVEANVKSRSRRSDFWQRFLTGRPSPTFIRRVRWILLLWWIVLLALEGPDFVRHFNEIRVSVPGVDRSDALQRLVMDGLTQLVAWPALLLAMLGYGVTIDRTAMVSGGPSFRTWWPSSRPKDRRTRQ